MSEEEIKECLDSLYYQDDVCSISYDKLKDYIIKLKTQLEQKENIIKEVREGIERGYVVFCEQDKECLLNFRENILEILDKEVN